MKDEESTSTSVPEIPALFNEATAALSDARSATDEDVKPDISARTLVPLAYNSSHPHASLSSEDSTPSCFRLYCKFTVSVSFTMRLKALVAVLKIAYFSKAKYLNQTLRPIPLATGEDLFHDLRAPLNLRQICSIGPSSSPSLRQAIKKPSICKSSLANQNLVPARCASLRTPASLCWNRGKKGWRRFWKNVERSWLIMKIVGLCKQVKKHEEDIEGLNMALEAKQQENSYLKQQAKLTSSSLATSTKTVSNRASSRPASRGATSITKPTMNLVKSKFSQSLGNQMARKGLRK
ncbi:hypothetical protein PCASD_22313 [Puccinia coronata f. sp. avenae]|uniref:Uncharacterized protein n=1 Tax=Puccinia coronata f. sp. avenae TaxID=200324 RepID=A0A2N5TW26_9BASI|nr:hypothetical protein PCASD_22313 [Puccinia coronata f. sp. avenae]